MDNANQMVKELNVSDVKLDVVALLTGVQSPAVSKMQNKRIGDVSLKKLKAFVEAVGGEFNVSITLANGEKVSF